MVVKAVLLRVDVCWEVLHIVMILHKDFLDEWLLQVLSPETDGLETK